MLIHNTKFGLRYYLLLWWADNRVQTQVRQTTRKEADSSDSGGPQKHVILTKTPSRKSHEKKTN